MMPSRYFTKADRIGQAEDKPNMTSKDILAVQRNWHIVSTDLTGLGVTVFTELFQLHDNYTDLFHGIRAEGEPTASNPKLREHALRAMSAFGSWIASLTDPEVLEDLLEVQGREHGERNVGPQHFAAMRRAIFLGLEKKLGNMFNRLAWDRVYTVFEEGLQKGRVEHHHSLVN